MKLTECLPDAHCQKLSSGSRRTLRVAEGRLRCRRRISLVAVLMLVVLTLCSPAHATTIHVNTTQQGVTTGQCSLQEAIYSSEFKTNSAIGATDPDNFYTTGCEPGTGVDTIELPSNEVFNFTQFWDGDAHNIFGPTATPVIFSTITIEGNGATLQWTGAGNSRLFAVAIVNDPDFPSGTGNLTLRNVYIKGFHVKGGDGGTMGGGGGLGAGGAIYVATTLTVENSTFDSNGAVGGNGNTCGSDLACNSGEIAGGGGGGMSGNGGMGEAGGAGGGGGSRGDGGQAAGLPGNMAQVSSGGGGGGGTVFSGGNGTTTGEESGNGGPGGYRCGGSGGAAGDDGQDAQCPGAGGGGGGAKLNDISCVTPCTGNGAQGSFGGGGGGGVADGGDGGFGGGGGGGAFGIFTLSGGNGGFGGGGGGAVEGAIDSSPGHGGKFGGNAFVTNAGGGGALGGAIFNHNGTVTIRNCTFTNNYVTRGVGGDHDLPGGADNGADAGGAIFSLDNTLEITDTTFSGNQSTGSGGAIVAYTDEGDDGGPGGGGAPVNLVVRDTIIANNGASECFFTGGKMFAQGAGNLIMSNGSGSDVLIGTFNPCPGVTTISDPQLQPLQLNSPGLTPTMAILAGSPAQDTADSATSLSTDQRGVTRPQGAGFDIGAYEARPPDFSFSAIPTISAEVGGSGSAKLTVNSVDYFNSAVALTISSSPKGVTGSFSPNSVTPPVNGAASSTLKISLAPTVTAGSYSPTVTGTSPPLTHSIPATVVVKATAAGIANVIAEFLRTGDIDNAGIAKALTSELSVAEIFISKGDNRAASDVLLALLNQLRAQSGKHIKASAASVLMTDTKALQSSLKCPIRRLSPRAELPYRGLHEGYRPDRCENAR